VRELFFTLLLIPVVSGTFEPVCMALAGTN